MEEEISRNKQMLINIVSSLVAFGINLIISFFLSPYIVKTLGVEANGFVSLANTFISYATLVTIALNSMAGRFITIAIHKEDYKSANKYYNAVFIGNLAITVVLVIPAILCIMKLENIINISSSLIWDVKILFSALFINFFIWTALPNWNTATFVRNKLYLQSLRGVESNLLKVICIVTPFIFFSPRVYYIGVATLVATIYTVFFAFYYKKKLLPEVKVNYKYFEISAVCELISSGVWNTITSAGQMLLSGLDLLIANLMIGSVEMGMLALAKTIPNVITSLAGTLTSVFAPSLTIDYAKGNQEALKNSMKQSMKLTGILLTIPLSIFIIYGIEFYSLWIPSENAVILQMLSILTCFGLIFTCGIQCLYNIFTVVNKIKINSILLLATGFISTGIVFILLKTTNLGIFAIAGVSSFINVIRNMVYTVPFAAKYLNFKWYTFFPEVLTSILSVTVLTIIGYIIKHFISINSWGILTLAVIVTSIIGLVINIYIVLNNQERKVIFNILIKKIKKN